MIQEAQKWEYKNTQHNNRNMQSQRNTKMLGYTNITCDVKLSSANKCHMFYDSTKELQLPDDSGLTGRLIDPVL